MVYRRAAARWENDLWAIGRLPFGLNELGIFHFMRGEYEAAEPLMRRVLAITEQSYGPKQSFT